MLPEHFEAMRERFSTEYDPDPGGPGWKLRPESLEKRECLAAMDVMWEALNSANFHILSVRDKAIAKVEAMGDDKS